MSRLLEAVLDEDRRADCLRNDLLQKAWFKAWAARDEGRDSEVHRRASLAALRGLPRLPGDGARWLLRLISRGAA